MKTGSHNNPKRLRIEERDGGANLRSQLRKASHKPINDESLISRGEIIDWEREREGSIYKHTHSAFILLGSFPSLLWFSFLPTNPTFHKYKLYDCSVPSVFVFYLNSKFNSTRYPNEWICENSLVLVTSEILAVQIWSGTRLYRRPRLI